MATKMTARPAYMEDGPSFFVSVGIGGLTQKIVDGGVVNASELDEDGGGDVALPCFVLAIPRLRHI